MAIDATGTPTSLGIPTLNTATDAPSGKGINAMMASIDTLLVGMPGKPAGIAAGETVVYNGGTFDRSTVTRIGATSLGTGTPDGTKFLRDDSTWQVVGGSFGVPVDLRNPQTAANAGNCFPQIVTLTDWEEWHWEYVKDVDGKLYGIVRVPWTPTAAKIVLHTAYNATSGVARWSVSWGAVVDGATFNPASLTNESPQDITVPGTARFRKDVTFTLGSQPASGAILAVKVTHEGSHANDTVAVNSELIGATLLPS